MSRRTRSEILADQRREAGYGSPFTERDVFTQPGKYDLRPGDEFSIPYRGRFIFQRYCSNDQDGQWVTAYGGRRGVAEVRSFPVTLMYEKSRVHRTNIKRQEIDRTIARGDQ